MKTKNLFIGCFLITFKGYCVIYQFYLRVMQYYWDGRLNCQYLFVCVNYQKTNGHNPMILIFGMFGTAIIRELLIGRLSQMIGKEMIQHQLIILMMQTRVVSREMKNN